MASDAAPGATYAVTSSSRIAAPLHYVKGAVRRLARGSSALLAFKPVTRLRGAARKLAIAVANYLLARPYLAGPAKRVLRRLPAVAGRFRIMLHASPRRLPVPIALADLSQHARQIYFQLKAAVAKHEADR